MVTHNFTFFIDAYAILKFVEELYMYEDTCMILRYIEITLIVINYIIFLSYLISRNKNNKKYIITGLLLIIIPILILIFSVIQSNWSIFILKYSFSYVIYSRNYIFIILTTILVYIASITWMYIKARKNKESNRVRLLLSLVIIMYICPMVIYIIMVIARSVQLKVIEITIAFLSCVTIDLIFNSNVSYGLTPFTFDKIKSVMDDYVFVTDINGKIVFRNENTYNIDLFNNNNYLKVESIKDIFNNDSIIVSKEERNNYISLIREDKSKYYSYRYKDLIDDGEMIGRIITFVDITQLIELLEQLKTQEQKTLETNKKLLEYKEVVYYLEKENEINILLEEITSVQEKSMFEIMGRIDNCALKIDDESFEEELENIILLTNKNLEEVRKAVTAYREYYGGNR